MRTVRIGIGLSLAALLMVLLVRNVDLHEAARTAMLVPLQILAASVALVLAGYSLRAWRWRLMLEGTGVEVTYGTAASIFFAAFALNNVLPLRAGDIYRCVAASRFQDGTIAKSLATLLAERLLDLAALTVAPEPSASLLSRHEPETSLLSRSGHSCAWRVCLGVVDSVPDRRAALDEFSREAVRRFPDHIESCCMVRQVRCGD